MGTVPSYKALLIQPVPRHDNFHCPIRICFASVETRACDFQQQSQKNHNCNIDECSSILVISSFESNFVDTVERQSSTNRPFAPLNIRGGGNLSGFCFPLKIKAFVI